MTGPEPSEIEDVALKVAKALERAGVPYFLVGSVASSMQGEPRATNDIDFVVRLAAPQVECLVRELGPEFDVDEQALKEAARMRRSWNVYFLPLVTKVDLFVAGSSEYETSQFSRRMFLAVGADAGIYVASPEDNVLFKLHWYELGGGVSTSQWRDVLGILRVSRASLDWGYLEKWAQVLRVEQLLTRARAEASPS